jgi:hypothetical protein
MYRRGIFYYRGYGTNFYGIYLKWPDIHATPHQNGIVAQNSNLDSMRIRPYAAEEKMNMIRTR